MKPSDWIARWSHVLAPGATVLDVACGSGRHLAWFAQRGHRVTGLDRSVDLASQNVPSAELVCADIETADWPLLCDGRQRTFDAVIVTHYLWRPLLNTIIQSVAPGGILLYETFATGNEAFGRPSRPDFLLQPGELLRACTAMDVVAYEHGYLPDPPRMVQRIAALQPASDVISMTEPARIAL